MLYRLFCIFLLARLAFSQNQCQQDRLDAVKSGETKVRGTNLGSWFVLESWMDSRPWSENGCNPGSQGGTYLLEKCLGDKAQEVLEEHWANFITENDFAELSSVGVNVARLPVGWWQVRKYLSCT